MDRGSAEMSPVWTLVEGGVWFAQPFPGPLCSAVAFTSASGCCHNPAQAASPCARSVRRQFARRPLRCSARHAGDARRRGHTHVAAIISVNREVLMPQGGSCRPEHRRSAGAARPSRRGLPCSSVGIARGTILPGCSLLCFSKPCMLV